MAAGISGDFGKLKRWEDRLRKTPKLAKKLNDNLAEETISLIQDGMKRGLDPYGRRYRKLALRSGQPLLDSGQMRTAWFRRSNRSGFEVSNAKRYSIFHQEGTGIYGFKKRRIRPKAKKALRVGGKFFKSVKGTPKRRMVPDRGIPKRWRAAYLETIEDVFISHFR